MVIAGLELWADAKPDRPAHRRDRPGWLRL